MTSLSQIRAGRALLGLSLDELARESGIALAQIRAADAGEPVDAPGIEAIAAALSRLGVSFISDGDLTPGGEGVRLTARHTPAGGDGMRPDRLNASNDD